MPNWIKNVNPRAFFLASCSKVNQGALDGILEVPETTSLTEGEVSGGLKEALFQGVNKAVMKASSENGFYQNPALFIAFPEEAIKVKKTAFDLGLNQQVDEFETTLNRAAEQASKQAAPIF